MLCTKCSAVICPIVAVDIDGTLGKYHEHFRMFAENYLGYPLPLGYDGSKDFEDWLGIPRPEYRAAKLAYRQGGFKRFLPTYPDAIPFMQALVDLKIDIWIATTRPWQRLDNIDPDTKEWLRRNRIPYDGVLFGEDKYKQLCDTVDQSRIIAAVEDLPDQFETAEMMGCRPIMIWRKHNDTNQKEPGFSNFHGVFEEIKKRREQWEMTQS